MFHPILRVVTSASNLDSNILYCFVFLLFVRSRQSLEGEGGGKLNIGRYVLCVITNKEQL